MGFCDGENAGKMFEALKSTEHHCIDFKTFHQSLNKITESETRAFDFSSKPPPLVKKPRLIQQPLEMTLAGTEASNADCKRRDIFQNTSHLTVPLANTDQYMSTADRFDRSNGNRERFIKTEKEKLDRLRQDRVENKAQILTLYEGRKREAESRTEAKQLSSLLSKQQKFETYTDVVEV